MNKILSCAYFVIIAAAAIAASEAQRAGHIPDDCRPKAWWFFGQTETTHEGITADAEAMKRVGFGGVVYYDQYHGENPNAEKLWSDAWWDGLEFAASEAARLGITFETAVGNGYVAGGPWIDPAHAMKTLAVIDRDTNGGKVTLSLPVVKDRGWQKTVAVLAIPLPEADGMFVDMEYAGHEKGLASTMQHPGGMYGYREKTFKAVTNSLPKISRWQAKTAAVVDFVPRGDTPVCIDPKTIRDVTEKFDESDRRLKCELPAGRWKVLRFVAVPTGGRTKHGRPEAMGLECDKMSVAAAELHWKSYTKRIIDRLKSKGIPLAGIILDSHEAGAQNWTDDMLEEFARRRGYDLRPYLPLMAGYCVAENAEEVFADFRRTCVELIAERYYGTFDRLCRDEGLSFTAQTGGGMFMIADSVFSKKYVSIPEGEFWGYQKFGAYDVKDTSSAAHLYGKKIASAEAMTDASYKMTIPELRRRCDLAFAFGVNAMTACAVPHLPKKDCGVKAPTGPREYGLNRSNPWWEDSRPFWDYIAFCSWMLRQGDSAPEALFYAGDDVPVKIIASKVPKALDGLDWDFATGDVAARMTKTADAWTTPEGVRYGYVVDSEGRTLAGAPPARRLNLPHISRLLPSGEKLAFIANDTGHEVKVDLGGESAVVIDPWTRCQTTESSVVIPPGESRFVKGASAADPVQKCESDGTSRVIRNDSWWNTVDGKPIYSNGGGCYFYEGRWYWYGCRYEEAERVRFDSSFQVDVGGLHTTFVGVTCYSSDDLVNWRDEGIVYAGKGAESEAHGRWFGRVGVAAVPSEGKFVLAMQYMGGVLLAVADSPRGPFVFQEGVDMSARIGYRTTGDQSVFYDDIHGKGYLVFSTPHGRDKTYVAELGYRNGRAFVGAPRLVFAGHGREGNCMFMHRGKYYLCASDLYGWDGSRAYWMVADSPMGPYRKSSNGDMFLIRNAVEDYCHVSQTGFFVTVRGAEQETVVFCGDRWTQFADNGIGFNVWTPLSFDGDEPVFNSLSEWSLDAATGRWAVGSGNNYVRNGSFDADRRQIPIRHKPDQDFVSGWTVEPAGGFLNATNKTCDKAFVTGKFALNLPAPFPRRAYQKIEDIPNGNYMLRYWRDDGKGWLRHEKSVCVTNGTHVVEFVATAPCRIDDVSLIAAQAGAGLLRAGRKTLSLDGTWRFSFQGGEERDMPVPSCWELQGVGTLRYGEADAKESGRYARTFAIPSDWPADDLVILRFDGVMFGAKVTVNGKDAGAFRSSFNRNELDITALVSRDAENTLVVETLKNPKGWGFDCNDDWILHGIFRSVTLISRPRLNVSDLSLACKVDAERGSAAVEISAAASDGESAVRLRLVDADGKTVLSGDAPMKGVVENARLWTCETPNLYTLVAEVGRDRVEKRVGLREITRDGAVLKLNGRPIKLHGVNHHDLCPCHGRAITVDELRRDAQLIKDGNFNCVRLAHYPPNEAFLDLCDELGLYAIDEVPFGMGTKNLRDANYFEVLEERARLTVARDKLHPSVIAWTVGNENPLTDICVKCGELVVKLDPTRPTCYPQYSSVYEKMLADGAPPSAMLYDFHYVNASKIRELAPRLDRPLFAGEFAHALGLDFGSLTETWEEMWKPECAGGCIWMFQDQGIARPASDVKEKDRKWLAWADEKTVWDTHGIDGCDGIVYSDRTPQVDYFAARAVFAPVKVEFDGKETLAFENRYDFTNLSETKISWAVVGQAHVGCVPLCCLSSLGGGNIEAAVAPHEKAAFKIRLPAIPQNVRVASLSAMVKGKDGEIVAAKAWPLKVDVKTTPNGTLPPLVFEPRWDRREMMSKSAAHLPKKNKKKYSILEKPAGFAADVKEEPLGDGSLHVAYSIFATQEWHTVEAGLSFTLPEEFTTVRWVGQGQFEAYTLSNAQSMFGWFALDKDDLYFPGNRRDVRWLAALRDDGTGVVLIPDGSSGDVAFENVGGQIRISHNAALADKFNKYEWPRDVKVFAAGEKLHGGFTLVPVKCHPGAAQPFRPFFKSYDDGEAKVSVKQSASSCEAALREGFANPPPDVKIGCYYYWVNERVDEEGVKKDLMWMKENGITRAFLATDIRNRTRFENPWEGQQFGDCTFRSEKWWRCLRTAFKTAGELGIEMGIFNCPGWSQSGGPWVTKEDAQIAPDGTYPENGPCSPAATGYEVDKTNRAAVRRHFDAFVGDILRRIPPAERPTLTTVVIDSWERGRVVKPEGDPRKLSDIIAEEYMGELTRCAHENGLITWCEPYSHSRGGWDGDSVTYGAAADEVSAEFWAGELKNERAKEIKAALGAARLGGKNKIYAESFTAGSWTKFAKDDWSFESLKPYADKFFRKGVNATILHVVISQPGDEAEPAVRPWFGTFFDRRSRNAAEMKKLVPYLRRCNFMLQQGRPADGRTDTRILPDGTCIRFTEQSLFEVVFPDGRTETWNPVSGKIGI